MIRIIDEYTTIKSKKSLSLEQLLRIINIQSIVISAITVISSIFFLFVIWSMHNEITRLRQQIQKQADTDNYEHRR